MEKQNKILEVAREIGLPISQISDGYHTFDELYEYRKLYHAAFINSIDQNIGVSVEKSKVHHDGTNWEGWFIIVIQSANFGQISNHYKIEDWDLFCCREVKKATEPWDGHTPEEGKKRLGYLVEFLATVRKSSKAHTI